jgi:hypothetical protein
MSNDFSINVVFGEGSEAFSEEIKAGIQNAADFWENVISGSTFDGDHLLTIEVGGKDLGKSTLAEATFSETKIDTNGNLLPIAGEATVNTNPEILQQFNSHDQHFIDTIDHEFGHVLGIGTLWEENKLIDVNNGVYNANTNAGKAYGELQGLSVSKAIPITTGEGEGSDLSHWQEEIFGNELMSHQGEDPSVHQPLSKVTIASLDDIGWNVNYGAAEIYPDSFTLASTHGDGLTDPIAVNDTSSLV